MRAHSFSSSTATIIVGITIITGAITVITWCRMWSCRGITITAGTTISLAGIITIVNRR